MRRVQVVPHDVAWKGEFQAEADQIVGALGDIVVALHHIGSTAIPGIFAKPIIDILLEAVDLETLDRQSRALEELAYEALGEFGIVGRRYFRKNNASRIRTHHVHAFQTGNVEIERHLAFRDYMVAHPEEARQYGELKQELATHHPEDIEAYMDGKNAYIKEQQAIALAWRRLQGRLTPP
jgi:GrpB-like predicted nucleotidyltransferase (UPF0157 family)